MMRKVTRVARAERAGWLLAAMTVALGPFACGSSEESQKSSRASPDRDESEEEEASKVDSSSRSKSTAGTTAGTGASIGGRPIPVASAAPVPVDAAPPGFKLDRLEALTGDVVTVSFSAPLVPPAGQQYWITLVKPDAPDGEFGAWHYVASGAASDTIKPASAGEYEIRLHDLYPKYKQGRVIARQRIKISAAKPVSGPFVPAAGFCSADSDCPASHYCGQQGNCFPRERPKAQSCPLGKSYWGPCERTGCQAGYSCSDRDNGGDGNCYCKS